jgi:streptomycin 6-kinase
MFTVSEEFSNRIVATFGADGEIWLNALPSILEDVSLQWSLMLQSPFEDMSYNYVAPATRSDGKSVVLKVGVPNPELQTETNALRIFNGRGAVRLLEADPGLGALLLERLDPGEAIVHLSNDEQATSVASHVMLKLHEASPENGEFPTVADWAKGLDRLRSQFDGGTGPFPMRLIEFAEASSRELLSTMDEPKLLHGDLHHWNILSAQRSPWLAIDPKGVIGEPAYETGAWLRNPFPELLEWPNPGKVIARRADQFSMELDFDRERILGWGAYQAVLAAWWSYEDGDRDWEKWIATAELIVGSK